MAPGGLTGLGVTPSSVHFMQKMRAQCRKRLAEVLHGLEKSEVELCSDARFLCPRNLV